MVGVCKLVGGVGRVFVLGIGVRSGWVHVQRGGETSKLGEAGSWMQMDPPLTAFFLPWPDATRHVCGALFGVIVSSAACSMVPLQQLCVSFPPCSLPSTTPVPPLFDPSFNPFLLSYLPCFLPCSIPCFLILRFFLPQANWRAFIPQHELSPSLP